MSWVFPEKYENEEQFELKLNIEKEESRRILMDSGLSDKVVFTNCMIPLQIYAVLSTGEMCYARNSRVGGDVTMWVFKEECDLARGWPPTLFEAEKVSDATNYIILAQEMVLLINQYLQWKKDPVSLDKPQS
jgi:hypothetical protein